MLILESYYLSKDNSIRELYQFLVKKCCIYGHLRGKLLHKAILKMDDKLQGDLLPIKPGGFENLTTFNEYTQLSQLSTWDKSANIHEICSNIYVCKCWGI